MLLTMTFSCQLGLFKHGDSEAAIHAMRAIFEDDNIHAALLVDSAIAFNLVNHQAALHNISGQWDSVYPDLKEQRPGTLSQPNSLGEYIIL